MEPLVLSLSGGAFAPIIRSRPPQSVYMTRLNPFTSAGLWPNGDLGLLAPVPTLHLTVAGFDARLGLRMRTALRQSISTPLGPLKLRLAHIRCF